MGSAPSSATDCVTLDKLLNVSDPQCLWSVMGIPNPLHRVAIRSQ